VTNEELITVLGSALPYVEGAYECAFPDEEANEDVAASIVRAIQELNDDISCVTELEAENQALKNDVLIEQNLATSAMETNQKLLAEIRNLKAENQRLREANPWIPVSERLPQEEGKYETTYEYGDGKRQVEQFWFDGKQFFAHYVIAWRELPEPYQEDL
jgi:hypothetical protein